MKPSQIPEESQRGASLWLSLFHELKFPMTDTPLAQGAQTAKSVPLSPSCSATCAPRKV